MKVDEQGFGRCSVPMWMGGSPCGFCDKPAFGERPDAVTHTRWDGFEWRDDLLYAGYVPGLACAAHGGPKTRTYKDGSAWCAVRDDFVNLQESAAGFGDTPEAARVNLEHAI
jgi:hypothetical protein